MSKHIQRISNKHQTDGEFLNTFNHLLTAWDPASWERADLEQERQRERHRGGNAMVRRQERQRERRRDGNEQGGHKSLCLDYAQRPRNANL